MRIRQKWQKNSSSQTFKIDEAEITLKKLPNISQVMRVQTQFRLVNTKI